MAALYNMLTTIQSSQIGERRFDIISMLPPEISTTIFRMLDPSSMHSSMQVCKTWYNLYRSDRPLRRTLRQKVREQKERRRLLIHNLSVRPTDSWYRNELPSALALNKRGLAKKVKKTRKSLTRHNNSAKPLRF